MQLWLSRQSSRSVRSGSESAALIRSMYLCRSAAVLWLILVN